MADLLVPRLMLRLDDYSSTRMTWGHSGLLDLQMIGLSPLPPCQFDWRTSLLALQAVVFIPQTLFLCTRIPQVRTQLLDQVQ